ncbi:MAG: type II secretion system protein [Alphaproteobacteria bacterium]|nr:type II secretion system protein [Alphaproteobacteria bacterium]
MKSPAGRNMDMLKRAGTQVRCQPGYTFIELMLYILIVTVMGLVVMRTVLSKPVASNKLSESVMVGLDRLMLAHQLTNPSCQGLVNDPAMTSNDLKSAANWCWMFDSSFNPTTRPTAYPSRSLSDFWGVSGGRDGGAGKYITSTGIPITFWYNLSFPFNVPVVTLGIGQDAEQIKKLGYDQCYSLVTGLKNSLVSAGFRMYLVTVKYGSVYLGSTPVPGLNHAWAGYDRTLDDYCRYPFSNINVLLN